MKFFTLFLLIPLFCFADIDYIQENDHFVCQLWEEGGHIYIKILNRPEPLSPYNHVFEITDLKHLPDCPCINMNY